MKNSSQILTLILTWLAVCLVRPASAEIDAVDLASYLDGIIEARMNSFGVAGTTVSVVYRGEVIFAKGYGYADVEAGSAVDPASTLFRPGSISKTFTWTAVMQLVEQGELDLDADLRDYVDDVPIPDDYGVITMRHLMTHRPGLEAAGLGHLFENNPAEILSLQEYLSAYPRAQVRPPGRLNAYSNWGTALAGHVVATLSGTEFETYIEKNILQPLDMHNSTFREPWGDDYPGGMSTEMAQQASKSYRRAGGGFAEGDYEFIHPVGPAGAISTTATDMARFMLMHLNDGTLDQIQVLQPETARLFQAEVGVAEEDKTGWAYGFIQYNVAGYHGFGHSGGTLHFLSNMTMIRELDLGLFISSNTPTGAKVMDGLLDLVVKRFFEDRTVQPSGPIDGFDDRAAALAGAYVSTRRSYTRAEALLSAPSATASVQSPAAGEIVINAGGESARYLEIEPYVFRELDGSNRVRFDIDSSGTITGFHPSSPAAYYEKIGFFGNPKNRLNLLAVAFLIFCLTLIGTWLRRKQSRPQSTAESQAAWSAGIMAVVWVLFIVLLEMGTAGFETDISKAMYEFPSGVFKFALVVALLGTAVTMVAAVLVYPVWRNASWPIWRRLRHTVVALAGIATVAILQSFNLLGFNY